MDIRQFNTKINEITTKFLQDIFRVCAYDDWKDKYLKACDEYKNDNGEILKKNKAKVESKENEDSINNFDISSLYAMISVKLTDIKVFKLKDIAKTLKDDRNNFFAHISYNETLIDLTTYYLVELYHLKEAIKSINDYIKKSSKPNELNKICEEYEPKINKMHEEMTIECAKQIADIEIIKDKLKEIKEQKKNRLSNWHQNLEKLISVYSQNDGGTNLTKLNIIGNLIYEEGLDDLGWYKISRSQFYVDKKDYLKAQEIIIQAIDKHIVSENTRDPYVSIVVLQSLNYLCSSCLDNNIDINNLSLLQNYLIENNMKLIDLAPLDVQKVGMHDYQLSKNN